MLLGGRVRRRGAVFRVEFEPVKVARILETLDGVREIGMKFDGADESDEEDE